MIDFRNCPKECQWILMRENQFVHLLSCELEFNYARFQIAKGKLEGYYLVRLHEFAECPENCRKYPINNYGVVENIPCDMFTKSEEYSMMILHLAMERME